MGINTLKAGDLINGKEITDIIIERALCSDLPIFNDERNITLSSFDEAFDWIMWVGVYRSGNFYLLYGELNNKSKCSSDYIDELPDIINIQLNSSEAEKVIQLLTDLGKYYFQIQIPGFSQLMNQIVSSIPCKISFEPLFGPNNGLYSRCDNSIIVANNNTQIGMIFALIHEYTHYLYRNNCSSNYTTLGDYINDKEELICNSVARRFVCNFLSDVSKSDNSFVERMGNCIEKLVEAKNIDYLCYCFGNLFFDISSTKTNEDPIVDELLNSILTNIEQAKCETITEIKQSGLVRLSREDNRRFYEFLKTISEEDL